MKNLGKKVVVGMSGGVDSSVAAYLLKQQGYEVIGVTMQIWQDEEQGQVEDNGGCCGLSAVDDARRVANALGIPYYVMNFKEDFRKYVIDYFVREYQIGRTPNPCIACNRYVKWESLLQRSLAIGADYIATGHYAKVVQLDNGRYALKKSKTDQKDQTYALYNLTQEQLSRTLMPVGDYEKTEIREIAAKISARMASKPDSQEICFVPDDDYAKFIEEYTDTKFEAGNFVDLNGNILGRHKGIIHYTIGQRKGLGLSMKEPGYVVDINTETLEVIIGRNEDVFTSTCMISDVNWMAIEAPEEELIVDAKIRYSHKPAQCRIRKVGSMYECTFFEKQRAMTKGQALVMYDQDLVVGGGVIVEVQRELRKNSKE